MNFKKWVKSIQTAAYNGARTVSRQVNTAVIMNENCKNSIAFHLLKAFLWVLNQYQYMAKITLKKMYF